MKLFLNVDEKEFTNEVIYKLKNDINEIEKIHLNKNSVLVIKAKKKNISKILNEIKVFSNHTNYLTHDTNKVNLENPFYVVRVDGIGFSKITKHLDSPFSSLLNNVMVNTAITVAKQLQNIVAIETHSDEISFYFNNQKNENTSYLFGKKEVKILTRIASLVSVTFLEKLNEYENNVSEIQKNTIAEMKKVYKGFDSKLFTYSNVDELFLYYKERQNDCFKNFISMFHRKVLGTNQKDLNGISTRELLLSISKSTELMEKWNNIEDGFRCGNFFSFKGSKYNYIEHFEVENFIKYNV